jgi:hypothetical protein
VLKKALDKELFAECYIFDTRQRASSSNVFFYRGFFVWHSAKNFFAKCKKHSAKYLVLGKDLNSGSDGSVMRSRSILFILFFEWY